MHGYHSHKSHDEGLCRKKSSPLIHALPVTLNSPDATVTGDEWWCLCLCDSSVDR